MKGIKKMDENELTMMVNIASIDPFDAMSIMIRKGDIENPVLSRPQCNDAEDDWSIPMKDMKRMERRKATFRKKEARQMMARDLGYNLSPNMTSGKVKTLLSANHMDRMYFRGAKVKKQMGKAMSTIEARNLMTQMEWEAEQDRLTEYKEAERQFALDELASKEDDLERLTFMENEMKQTISDLIQTIYEANAKLDGLYPRLNSLRITKEFLEKEIAKVEEVVNS